MVLAALAAGACSGGAAAPEALASRAVPYRWRLPAGFPEPRVPADNPMSEAKVALGRRLFYDERLSGDGRTSCASCHRQELGFADGRARALGGTGIEHPRGAMSLTNVAYNASLTWARPDLTRLERQLEMPLFASTPVEMGATARGIERRLAGDARTVQRFRAAFPGDPRPLRIDTVARALASFERTLVSGNSPYDRWLFWDERHALSGQQRRGMDLFFSPRAGCSACHAGFNLSGPVVFVGSPDALPAFHNTNLHTADSRGSHAVADPGLYAHTGRTGDRGRFRAPTLRNVARTAPYMHDGSVPTLEAVIDHYAVGGRARPVDPGRDPLIRRLDLSADEKVALLEFLGALTDETFLTDPRFSDPGVRSRKPLPR